MPTPERMREMNNEFTERALNRHDLDYIEDMLADDFIEHTPLPGLGNDKKGALETFRALFAATPDMKYEVEDLIVSGDMMAIRGRVSGTDSGTGQFPGVAPTGKTFAGGSIDVVKVGDDGKFHEHYGIADVAGIMMQLGLMPGADG